MAKQLSQMRLVFMRALLDWLRAGDPVAALQQLRGVMRQLQRISEVAGANILWSKGATLVAVMLDHRIGPQLHYESLLRRLDQALGRQIKGGLEGSDSDLLSDLAVAIADLSAGGEKPAEIEIHVSGNSEDSSRGVTGGCEKPSQPCVLVVDDSLVARKLVCRILQHDYTVATAADADAALQQIEQQRPDLLLLEIEIPGMDAHDLILLLRARPDTAGIPVLVLSSGGSLQRARDRNWDVSAWLEKPYSEKELLQVVHSVFSGTKQPGG